MPLICKKSAKCYIRKDKKRCLAPNGWIVFLRTNKNTFSSSGEASIEYQKNFKPFVLKLVSLGSKNKSLKKMKEDYHKAICNYFYDQMKGSGKSTTSNKKKVRAGVSKILKENSIPKTLEIMGAKHIASALAAKEKAVKKADAEVAAKEKTVELAKAKAANIIKQALRSAIRARKLKREAASAKTKAVKTKSKSKSPSACKAAKSTAAKKKKDFSAAKRKADRLQNSAENAKKKVKTATKAVVSAKKTATKAAKRKVPRALAGLDTSLIISDVGKKRRKRG